MYDMIKMQPLIDMFGSYKAREYEGKIPDGINIPISDRTELAKALVQCKKIKSALSDISNVVDSNFHELSLRLGEVMDEDNLPAFDLSDEEGNPIAKFKSSTSMHCQVLNTEKFHAWLVKKGYGKVIKETVHHKTRDSIIREVIKEGGGLIDQSICKTFMQTLAKVTKVY